MERSYHSNRQQPMEILHHTKQSVERLHHSNRDHGSTRSNRDHGSTRTNKDQGSTRSNRGHDSNRSNRDHDSSRSIRDLCSNRSHQSAKVPYTTISIKKEEYLAASCRNTFKQVLHIH